LPRVELELQKLLVEDETESEEITWFATIGLPVHVLGREFKAVSCKQVIKQYREFNHVRCG